MSRLQRCLLALLAVACTILAVSHPALAQDAPPDDGNWVMAAKSYARTRFSELDEINAGNVRDLHVSCTLSTGVVRGHEAAPLVVNGTMYVVTLYPNHLHALDLTKPDAPAKWTFEPKPAASAQGVACCDYVNRGPAFADGKVFITALDAATGNIVWRAYGTGPDMDVLIGPDCQAFYDKEKGKDLGVGTWPPNAWEIGGGTM